MVKDIQAYEENDTCVIVVNFLDDTAKRITIKKPISKKEIASALRLLAMTIE